jgi:hypothetical protein
MTPDVIGSVGVALLLCAFAANLFDRLPNDGFSYQALNFCGAAIAAYASWLIAFYPFVLLEGVWAVVSLVALFRTLKVHVRHN